MAKEFAKKFYQSKAWKSCRNSYIAKRVTIDGGMCERCKERVGYILHHKVLLTAQNINDPYIALNHSQLEYLCKPCHDNEHYTEIHGAACTFGSDGQPIPPIKKIET